MTPAVLPGVVIGAHRIELHAKGRAPWAGTVEIRDGKATYLNATLLGAKP